LDFGSLVVYVNAVVIVDALRIFKKFLEVGNVLLNYVSDVVQLGKLMTVVIFEHTLGAD